MQEYLLKVVTTLNNYLTDYVLVVMLLGVGIFYSVKTRFVQVRCLGGGIKNVFKNFKGDSKKGGLSNFQAFTTAVAGQIGIGNIIGVCGAILIGGPGAVFWMCFMAFFGMATIYAEAVLAQETKIIGIDGNVTGGPAYYIKRAFIGKFGKVLSIIFAICSILSLGFFGVMVQTNSISQAICNAVKSVLKSTNSKIFVSEIALSLIVGIIISLSSGVILVGGVKRLGKVTGGFVPIMVGTYFLGCVIVIIVRIIYLPEALFMIIKYAFIPNSFIGGGFGYALKTVLSQGAKRGLFSNEAGMGSTPHAHALANAKSPHEQGVIAMVGVFLDTIILLITAIVVLITLYAGNGVLSSGKNPTNLGVYKNNMTQLAFSSVFGDVVSNVFVALCLVYFAFSSVITWNMFGRANVEYLFGKKYFGFYTAASIIFMALGAVLSNDFVWGISDFFNYLIVVPNVIALFALSNVVTKSSFMVKKDKKNISKKH